MVNAISPVHRLYDESLDLLIEARNYFTYGDGANVKAKTPNDKLYFNYHSLRLTSRLTQVMAWMLAQRAVLAGEISNVEACAGAYSLGGEKICTDPAGANDDALPQGLRNMLERSHSLYMRVWRLDRAAREKFA